MRQRAPRERDPVYLGWVAKLPCVACFAEGRFNRQVQVAHLRAGSLEHDKRPTGMAEKPSDFPWVNPLCPAHHQGDRRVTANSQHQRNEIDFWAVYGICPFDLCLDLAEAYSTGRSGASVIARHVAAGKRAHG